MMRRVWAAICTTFAVVAVFTVLAVTHRPPATAASGAGTVVLVRSDDGLVPVTIPSGGAHATTRTSPTSAGAQVPGASGQIVAATQSHPTTRSS